jgi:MFS family permease
MEFRPTQYNYCYLARNCFAAGFILFYTGLEIGSILHLRSQMPWQSENPRLSLYLYITLVCVSLSLGSMSAGLLSLKIGRRHLLLLGIGSVLSGSLIVSCRQILIDSHTSFLIAKVLASYGGGLGSAAAPIYSKSYLVKEMTPNIDLKFACFVPFALVLGLATAISFMRLSDLQNINWWQLQYIGVAVISFIHFLVIALFFPDTPHWYYETNQPLKGDCVIRQIYADPREVIGTKICIKEESSVLGSSPYCLAVSCSKL